MRKLLPFLLVFAVAGSVLAAPKPRITSPSTDSGTIGVPYSYQITADQAITTWGATPLPAGLTINTSTGLISGTPTVVGVFSITLSATNVNGTGTGPLTLTIGNPVPTTSSINPSSCLAGSPQFTLTVNGTNFVATSTVRWNGTALSTTFVSSTQLTATVTAALVANAGTASVTVVNPAPGGGTSNPQTFTINNPVPTTSSINPTCATAGGAQFTLTVTGTNFVSTSTVNWNGTALTTTFVSSTQLTATVTAARIATPGTASVTVVNPGPGGGTSNAQTFTIAATPVITSPLTACGAVGVAFSYTIAATNSPTTFSASPLPPGLSVNTSTGMISGTPTTAGTTNVTITASNGATPCNTSAQQTLVITIGNPPVITSPLAACGTVGVAFSYTITATNNPTSFSASPLPAGLSINTSTGVISGTPTTAGTTNVTISASNGTNPCIYTGSATLVITISARPTISSLNPTCATAGGAQFTLTVNGTNYVSGSAVNWNGTPLTTTFVSGTQLTATVPASLIATAGTASITVVTPNPCGGVTSSPATFTVADPPVVTSPSTACGTIGVAFSYTITATNNPTSFTASPLPPGLSVNTGTGVISGTPTTAGTTNVTITASNGATPCNTGSATLVITISAAPSITSLNPNCAVAGGPQFTLTVNGTNFISGSTVRWNGTALTTTFVSSTQLTATVQASLIATAGTASISVISPCGGTSNAVTFTINATPTITSTSPTCATVGGPQFTLTVNGTNYVSVSTVNWNGAPLATTFVSATQLRATVPAALIATAGTASITVVTTNACGTATSNAVTFAIVNTPVITSSLTACGTVGVAFSYTITATNNPTSFTASPLPAGLSVNTNTGVISGTPTTAGTTNVTITASNGAGTCNTASATLVITISSRPTISSLNPTCTAAGGPQFTLTVNGTNYVSGSTVNWNGSPLATAFVSATQLTATVPAALIATAGTASITVVSPCGGTSNAQTFNIAATPVITSPLTACGTVGVAFSYTITATNNPTSFTASPLPAGLTVNTSTGVISGTPTQARQTIVTITASNGAGSCNTATATLVITIGTAPTISSISPTCTGAGGPQFTLTVNGPNNDFIQGDTVYWNGSPLVTTFVSDRQLRATVPAALIAAPGTASITVGGCGGTSGAAMFTISATPTITSLNPTCANAGDTQFTLTVNGTNFVSTSIVNWSGAALPTTFVSSTLLTATVSATRIATPGTFSITVGSPCAGTSNAITFRVDDTPSITSSLTASATLGTPFSYQITADNNPTSFDATDLPGGLTVCHNSSEGCTPGLISGTPTALGVFPITISATNVANDPCSGTATDTLALTITLPGGTFIPPFPGQVNVFGWGSTPPSANITIPFPNATTDNYFVLYWNAPGSNTNQAIADSANGGLRRSADTTGMSYNPYDPTIPNSRPDLTKNVWRGNPIPPNDNTSGQFGDPRGSWYITDPWPTADYVTSSYWAGPNPNMVPLNWPDSGHPFSYTGLQPADKGQYPTDIMASPTPSPDPTKSISLLSDPNRPNPGNLTSITELGNVWDPAQLSYAVANPGGALPDIPTSALRDSRGAGGHTLAIGRPEFSMFDQPPIGGNLMRAWQLLDLFSSKTSSTNFTSTAGLVNLNTASRDVLRSLAVGILQNSDPAIQPASLLNNLYPPTATGANVKQADLFADAVINSRPLLSTSALSAMRDCGQNIPCSGQPPQPFFGNPNQYNGSTQAAPTEWNDPGREELFAKIYNLATTRSRNFRVFVTGQSLDKNGRVLSTVTKVYHVFIKPNRDSITGAIQSQQVQIKYEGSM